MKSKNSITFIFAALTAAVFTFSCASGPVVIPEDMTAPEMIQRAQEASDTNDYSTALQYYETIIQRFPLDIDSICAAEYEIAFIHYKQKKFDIAKAEFTNLLERYNTPNGELLPPEFRVLSQKILARISELEASAGR